jgi:zinc transporter ZupT
MLQVAVMTTLMGSASGLGAVPFFFVGSLSAEWAALANALACGVMLAASFDLVHEGQPYGAGLTILGVILGGLSSGLWLAVTVSSECVSCVEQHWAAGRSCQPRV